MIGVFDCVTPYRPVAQTLCFVATPGPKVQIGMPTRRRLSLGITLRRTTLGGRDRLRYRAGNIGIIQLPTFRQAIVPDRKLISGSGRHLNLSDKLEFLELQEYGSLGLKPNSRLKR